MQENNFDALTICDGAKGSGKSSTTIYFAKEYLSKYSFVCPRCGNEFFKNVFAVKENERGMPIFYIPDYVKDDTAWIECPVERELDLRTGERRKKSGCGYQFKYSRRRRIKWDASKFIAYDNSDVIEKLFNLPTFSPLVCDEAVRFACLTDDVLISMPRDLGKYPGGVPIKDLVGRKDFDVYSWNTKKDRLELSKCCGCFYVKDADVYEVELVSGEKIRATADHKFVLMGGQVKLLRDLVWFYDSWGNYGRRCVKVNSNPKGKVTRHGNGINDIENFDRLRLFFEHVRCGGGYIKVGKPSEYMQEGRFIYQQINGEVPEDFIVHHKDENLLNNNVENLKGMMWGEHSRMTVFNNFNHKVHGNKAGQVRQPKRENPLSLSQVVQKSNVSKYGGLIKSIRYIGKKSVFSLVEVSKNHNYFANNILCENSAFEHNKTESKELKKLFTVIRPRKLWIFFNIPSIKWIDSKYREGMASFWLRMIERGNGVLFEADKGVTQDIWHLKELEASMGTIKFFTPMDKVRRSLMKHPCYFDMFRFPELDVKVYDDYEMVRNAVNLQRQVEEQSLSNKDVAKMGAYNLLNNWDRIAVAIQRSKENRMTYNIMANEVFFNPVLRKRVVSDVTIRAWVRGVQEYIKTLGKDVSEFAGSIDLRDGGVDGGVGGDSSQE